MTNEHNIESRFSACMHKEYCLSLKAQIRPLDENALAHTINMMPWRTDELGPQLREFAAQLWLQFCSVPAAATAHAVPQGVHNKIKCIKVDLMHQRRFGADSLQGWRSACTSAEGDIEDVLKLIAATPSPAFAAPQGWKLVPVEPTQEMMDAMPSMPAIGAPGDMDLKNKGWSLKALQNRHRWITALAATPAAPSQPVTLTDFDAIPDEVIDAAQEASGMYRVELMRAWDAIIAALRKKEQTK